MPFSEGIITIGNIGSMYPDIDTAKADYVSPMTGNLTFVIEADTTWNTTFNLENTNGYDFRITCANGLYHYGDYNKGVLVTLPPSDVAIQVQSITNSYCIIEKLKFFNGRFILRGRNSTSGKREIGHIVRKNILNKTSIYIEQTYFVDVVTVGQYICDNKFDEGGIEYDFVQTTSTGNEVDGCQGLIENNVFYTASSNRYLTFRGGDGGVSKCYCTIRNNVGCGFGGGGGFSYYFVFPCAVSPYAYKNYSENNTAETPINGSWRAGSNGNVGGINPANEFQSLNVADSNYLKLIDGIRRWV